MVWNFTKPKSKYYECIRGCSWVATDTQIKYFFKRGTRFTTTPKNYQVGVNQWAEVVEAISGDFYLNETKTVNLQLVQEYSELKIG